MSAQSAAGYGRLARRWLEACRNGGGTGLVRVVEFDEHRRAGTGLRRPVPGSPSLPRSLVLLEAADCGGGLDVRDSLAVRAHFTCGEKCRFHQPVYTGANCHIGKSCRLDAVVSDGSLILCAGTAVRRWADSQGWMTLRAGVEVGGAASSRTAVRMAVGARARSVQAPEVSTPAAFAAPERQNSGAEPVVIPHPAFGHGVPALPGLEPLGADTWVWDGDLLLPNPLLLGAKLLVTGSFACGAGSLLEDDVRAEGDVEIGPDSVCRGYLTAGGLLLAASGCLLEAGVSARAIRLGSGVRVCRREGPVEISATAGIALEPGVIVRGSLRASVWVESVE